MFLFFCSSTKYFSSLFCQRNGHKVALRRCASKKHIYNQPTVAEQVLKKKKSKNTCKRYDNNRKYPQKPAGGIWNLNISTANVNVKVRSHDLGSMCSAIGSVDNPSNVFIQCQIQIWEIV